MSILQELNRHEITQVILSAAERSLPLTLTVRQGQHWASYQSRLAGLRGRQLLLQAPQREQDAAPRFHSGESIGVSLKLKHHKYLFLAGVADFGNEQAREGTGPLLVLDHPTRMQRLQRRSYIRAQVPSGCLARAAFWVGGHLNEPAGGSPDRPVWNGRVVNLSAGGFSVRTSEECVRLLEMGYFVGTRLLFGVGQEAVYADACVRHIAPDEDGAVVGFQFLGLEYSDEGKSALQAISRKVNEFHAIEARQEEAPRTAASAAGAAGPKAAGATSGPSAAADE
jgi:c-di-GMP-binding flagellar brake protein YcgR